jgi:uncharacterized protein
MRQTVIPDGSSDRADILDVLRGFAILGIFLANSGGFSLYMFATPEAKAALSTHNTDTWIHHVLTALVEGKFYSLFSLLFGIGFSIICERNLTAGRNPLIVFYRRLLILALFGLCHLFLMWEGDILLLYALIGFALPLFRKCTDRTLVITAVVLLLSPLLFDLAKVLSDGAWDLSKPLARAGLATDALSGITESNYRTYLVDHNTYQSVLNWNRGSFFWRYEYIIASNRIPKVLAMFLLGFVAGRNRIFSKLETHKALLKRILNFGFALGIPASILFAWFQADKFNLPDVKGMADTLFYAISVVPLSLAYATSLSLLWMKPGWNSRLRLLAPAGRMALTNYIAQTAFGIFFFYGIGLGFGAETGPSVYVLVAIGFFCFQVWYSNVWFRYFRFGPLEWIWRMMTYGKRLPILK